LCDTARFLRSEYHTNCSVLNAYGLKNARETERKKELERKVMMVEKLLPQVSMADYEVSKYYENEYISQMKELDMEMFKIQRLTGE
jgi:hypothetical protein